MAKSTPATHRTAQLTLNNLWNGIRNVYNSLISVTRMQALEKDLFKASKVCQSAIEPESLFRTDAEPLALIGIRYENASFREMRGHVVMRGCNSEGNPTVHLTNSHDRRQGAVLLVAAFEVGKLVFPVADAMADADAAVDVKLHFVRDYVDQGVIDPLRVSSKDNLADCLTKALGKAAYEAAVTKLVAICPETPVVA